jgi:hypothetical protein
MSQNSNSPFESSTSDKAPQGQQPAPLQINDLYQANKAASQQVIDYQTMMPALGMTPLPKAGATGGFGLIGPPLLLLTLLVVPPMAALLYDKLWHFGNMLIFSALALGVLVGFAMYPAIHFGKVRNKVMAVIVGGLVGLASIVGAMGLEAWGYRDQFVNDDVAFLVKSRGMQPQQAKQMVEAHYTPFNMTKTYWEERGAAGMTITSSKTRTQSQISGTTFWVLQGLEVAMVTIIVAGLAAFFAGRRYSDEFDRWYNTKLLGSVHAANFQELMAAANSGDWARVRSCIGSEKSSSQVGAQLDVAYLPQKPGGWLTISAKVHKNKGLQPIFTKELTDEEMKAAWPAFPAPAR